MTSPNRPPHPKALKKPNVFRGRRAPARQRGEGTTASAPRARLFPSARRAEAAYSCLQPWSKPHFEVSIRAQNHTLKARAASFLAPGWAAGHRRLRRAVNALKNAVSRRADDLPPCVRHADTRHTARARTGTPGHARHTHAHRDTRDALGLPACHASPDAGTHTTPRQKRATMPARLTACPASRRYRLPCL